MKITLSWRLAILFACAIFSLPSLAQVTTLTFEGLKDNETISNYYNGGTGSLGSSGPNYGVSFGTDALALIDSDAPGGTGNFANEPSPSTVAVWFSGGSLTMNVAAGFATGFSFFYSSSTAATVTVYDGLNGTGNVLGTINLLAQSGDNCGGDPNGTFCNWSPIGLNFSGTARSVDFSGTANQTGYDNITFGSATPGGAAAAPIPTLAAWALILLGGLLGLIAVRRLRFAN